MASRLSRCVPGIVAALLLVSLSAATLPHFHAQVASAADPSFPTDDRRFFGNPTDNVASMAAGDLNGDGSLDLVVAKDGAQSAVYLNDGAGGFAQTLPFGAAQDAISSVAVGDINGDGRLDIVAGRDGGQSTIYLNDGAGSWQTVPFGGANDQTRSVALGDLNGDGRLDIVAGKIGTSALYLNKGAAGFQAVLFGTANDQIFSVAIADMNGDTWLDIIAGNYQGRSAVYLNNSLATGFAAVFFGGANATTRSVVVGDINGDGTLDIITGNYDDQSIVYLSDGGGGVGVGVNFLQTTWTFGSSAEKTRSVAVADVNGDGSLDIIAGNSPAPGAVYLNAGVNTFTRLSLGGTNDQAYSVVAADMNADSAIDIVVGYYDQQSVVFVNSGAGSLGTKSFPFGAATAQTVSVAVGDMDGNGSLDVVAGNNGQQSVVYLNNGFGSFTQSLPFGNNTDNTQSIALGDLDGDGDLDIVVGRLGQQSVVYWNNGAGSMSSPQPLSGILSTSSVALGDLDGNGTLDIVAGGYGSGSQSVVYLNAGGGVFQARTLGTGSDRTLGVAVGDLNGDGALDIVAVNQVQQSTIYLNDGTAHFQRQLFGNASDNATSVALGDLDGDGRLDIAVGLYRGQNLVYLNDSAGSFARTRRFGTGADKTQSVALGDIDGDGHLDIVAGNQVEQNVVYLNDGAGNFASDHSRTFGTGTDDTWSVTLGDIVRDGALDLVVGNRNGQSRAYINSLSSPNLLANNPPSVAVVRPGTVRNGGLLSTPEILANQYIAIPYTLTDRQSDPVRAVQAAFSLDGGDNWRPALPQVGTTPASLTTSYLGTAHTFVWDTFASGFFGQSDNVVVRLRAYPATTVTAGGTPLFQRPFTAATSFPFRVRGTQVRAVGPGGAPSPGAIVYRQPSDPIEPSGLIAPTVGQLASTTDTQGYLRGRGKLALNDTLVVLAPVAPSELPAAMRPFSDTIDLYATNITYAQSPTGLQLQGTNIQASGVQTAVVSLAHPLALVNLVVSLEWDARNDTRFMTQLRYNVQRASELLFDATNGQVALGQVSLFFAKENWDNAHIRIYASNRVRPNAVIGGIATTPFTSTYTVAGQPNPIPYGPGQLLIGATWNRYGEAGASLSDDWPRVLVHELGHFLFFLDDHYVGRSGDVLTSVEYAACPGLMHDPYASVELHPSSDWRDPARHPDCSATLADQELGESDWATLQRHYPVLIAPSGPFGASDSLGPVTLHVPFAEIYEYTPLTPTITLESPVFYTSDQATGQRVQLGTRSRAFLFQDDSSDADSAPDNRIVPLGRATLDQVLARGAGIGDRVCVFEDRQQQGGCTIVSPGNEQLPLTAWGTGGRPPWQPDIAVTPVTSTTLQVQVGGLETGLTIQAALYPVENPQAGLIWPVPITLNATASGYSGNFSLPAPLNSGFVHIWVAGPQPHRESVVSFTMDGNAGAGIRSTGGGGIRSTGGAGIRSTGGGGIRSTGGAGIRSTGGAGIRSTGGTFVRSGNAAIATSEADVLFVDPDLTFATGQFLLLQQVATPPMLPPGTTFVGTAYRFSTSVANPPLVGPQAAVSFGYLGAEVPAGEEDGIRVYYYDGSGGAGWQLLSDTRLDTYHNLASARYRGPGIYALMSSLVVPLVPGWSNIGYPAPVARSAPDTMASVAGQYSVVYHYNPANTGDPWEVYSPAAPDWVNNLHCMVFGQGYWVYSTSPTTATLRIRSASDPGEVTGCESAARDNPTTLALSEAATPPATFYGTIAASPSLAVAPGLPVVAWVNGAICGQGVTQAHDGQVAYIVRVAAANTAAPDCGRTGSLVRFTVAGRPSGEAQWRSESVQSVDLLPEDNKVFLPLVWR